MRKSIGTRRVLEILRDYGPLTAAQLTFYYFPRERWSNKVNGWAEGFLTRLCQVGLAQKRLEDRLQIFDNLFHDRASITLAGREWLSESSLQGKTPHRRKSLRARRSRQRDALRPVDPATGKRRQPGEAYPWLGPDGKELGVTRIWPAPGLGEDRRSQSPAKAPEGGSEGETASSDTENAAGAGLRDDTGHGDAG